MKLNKTIIISLMLTFFMDVVFSQSAQTKQYESWQLPLLITTDDIQLLSEEDLSGEVVGFHLYIRKKEAVESVLLCETTKDPQGKSNNYAYRALEYNPINGDELRLLDGKPLVSEGAKYSLIDSTPEKHPVFNEAFHIYIFLNDFNMDMPGPVMT